MKTSRKEFLKTLSAASVFSIAPARVLFGAETPSNTLTRSWLNASDAEKETRSALLATTVTILRAPPLIVGVAK